MHSRVSPGIFLSENRANSVYSVTGSEFCDNVVGYNAIYVDDVVSYVAASLVDES